MRAADARGTRLPALRCPDRSRAAAPARAARDARAAARTARSSPGLRRARHRPARSRMRASRSNACDAPNVVTMFAGPAAMPRCTSRAASCSRSSANALRRAGQPRFGPPRRASSRGSRFAGSASAYQLDGRKPEPAAMISFREVERARARARWRLSPDRATLRSPAAPASRARRRDEESAPRAGLDDARARPADRTHPPP